MLKAAVRCFYGGLVADSCAAVGADNMDAEVDPHPLDSSGVVFSYGFRVW